MSTSEEMVIHDSRTATRAATERVANGDHADSHPDVIQNGDATGKTAPSRQESEVVDGYTQQKEVDGYTQQKKVDGYTQQKEVDGYTQQKEVVVFHKLLTGDEVDDMFREPFIHTGYRLADQPWTYYLSSLFWLHNESVNVWTHLLGCCLVIARAVLFGSELDHFRDPRSWSVLGFALSCIANNLLSATAHLLQSKSPRHHNILYIIDYAGITIYNLGNAIGSMYSCSGSFMYSRLEGFFLPMCVFLCWVSFLAMARSRLAYREQMTMKRKVILVSLMAGNAVFLALPMMCRYAECLRDEDCSLASLHHITIVFLFFAMDGLCFAAHCPERWFPGRFDVWGHSHQLFHLLVIMTQQLQFHAQHVDIVQLQQSTHVSPSFTAIFSSFLVLMVAEAVTLLLLSNAIDDKVRHDAKVKVKQH
nr:hypothetical protein BaRGS_023302 [Batillaria attramentaria]